MVLVNVLKDQLSDLLSCVVGAAQNQVYHGGE